MSPSQRDNDKSVAVVPVFICDHPFCQTVEVTQEGWCLIWVTTSVYLTHLVQSLRGLLRERVSQPRGHIRGELLYHHRRMLRLSTVCLPERLGQSLSSTRSRELLPHPLGPVIRVFTPLQNSTLKSVTTNEQTSIECLTPHSLWTCSILRVVPENSVQVERRTRDQNPITAWRSIRYWVHSVRSVATIQTCAVKQMLYSVLTFYGSRVQAMLAFYTLLII